MAGEFTNLYINVQTLGEKVNVQLVMTMVLKEVDFIGSHEQALRKPKRV